MLIQIQANQKSQSPIFQILPINIKGSAGSLTTLVNCFTSWIVSYAFNFLFEWNAAGNDTLHLFLKLFLVVQWFTKSCVETCRNILLVCILLWLSRCIRCNAGTRDEGTDTWRNPGIHDITPMKSYVLQTSFMTAHLELPSSDYFIIQNWNSCVLRLMFVMFICKSYPIYHKNMNVLCFL